MSLAFYLNIVMGGLLTGLVLGLAALGLALIHNVTRVINLAHGGLMMAGMMAAAWFAATRGADPLLAVPMVAAGLFLFGFLLHRVLINRLSQAPGWLIPGQAWLGQGQIPSQDRLLLLMLGVALMVMNGLAPLAGPDGRGIRPPNAADALTVGPFLLDRLELRAALVALMVTVSLVFFFNISRTGKAIRACADSPLGARVVGLNVPRLQAITVGLGAAITGTAGCLLAQIAEVRPTLAPDYALTGFIIVLIGGLGSVGGALLGGMLIGVTEALGSALLLPPLKSLPGCVLLILLLLLRPHGLFGPVSRTSPVQASGSES